MLLGTLTQLGGAGVVFSILTPTTTVGSGACDLQIRNRSISDKVSRLRVVLMR